MKKLFQTVADLASQVMALAAEVWDLRSTLSSGTVVINQGPAQLQVWVSGEVKELHEGEKIQYNNSWYSCF